MNEWRLSGPDREHLVQANGNLRANNGDLLRVAALGGTGIVLQPRLVGADLHARRLQSVFTVYRSRELGIYAVYPSRKYLSATVRTFIDFLVERFGPNPDWGDWRQQRIHPISRGVKNPPTLLGLDYSALMR